MLWVWLAIACLGSFVDVALPLAGRLAVCAIILFVVIRALRRHAWLRGPHAVHALDWSGKGWRLEVGHKRRIVAVTLVDDGVRTGGWRILRFRSAEGIHPVYLDGRCQDDRAFRRLCRRLQVAPLRAPTARSTS